MKIAARSWGPKDGVPVLGIHGWLDNAATFDGIGPSLNNIRFTAIDLPGHGLSGPIPEGMVYYFLDAMWVVEQVTKALEWKQFSFLCHSLGAAVASLYAGAFPEQIRKMVLLDGLGPLTSSDIDSIPDKLRQHLQERELLSKKKRRVFPTLEAAIGVRQAVGDISAQSAKTLATRGTEAVEGGYIWRSDPRLRVASPMRMSESQVLAYLKRIKCPTLLFRAERRMAFEFNESLFAKRIETVDSLQVVDVPGGHHFHLDSPQLVTPQIQAFLE